jgi:ADP-ribose pyrophosphatase YjhB (NUDIX family)
LALPGGRIDPEETAAEAALRELREGLGVGAHPDQIIGELDDLTTQSGYVITPFVVWIGRFAGALRPNAAEVAGVRSITMAEVDALPRFVAEPHTDISVPTWSFRGTDIHASTAAILYQFREVTLHQRNTRVAHYGGTLLAPQ